MPPRLLFVTTALLVACRPAAADDWPQWMGPNRDNIWRETGILSKFPSGGPKVVWRTPISAGYSGPAVADGRVYITDRILDKGAANPDDPFDTSNIIPGTERVLCLDQKTGKVLWKHEYRCPYQISYPAGPRCTPLVQDGRVYTLGAMGDLICFRADTGKIVWQVNLPKAYKTKPPLWGYAAHPQIDGKKLITIAGGTGSHIVALNKDTGQEIWRTGTQAEPGYSPPLITEAAGKRQMVVFGTKAVYAVDPETGKQYWTTPYSADSGCVIMTPVRAGDYLYFGGYNHKNLLLKLTADKPGVEVVFKDKRGAGLSPVNVQPFLQDGVLYGFDDDGTFYAVELPSGKRLWEGDGPVPGRPSGSETAFIVKNGDRFFFFAETGHLVIGKLSPQGYDEIDRAKLLEPTNSAVGRKVVWSAPAYAGKQIFARNDQEIICVDLAE
jgi:outer membrane protein assembly factor BamB